MLVALTRGAPITLVTDYVVEAPYEMAVRPEIARVADLRDKKIGVSGLRGGS